MGLADITVESVREAVAEFDRIGREAFLDRYGFKPAREYFLVIDGRRYDSKAICGAAHGYARRDLGPLRAEEFSGGSATVQRRLEELGFRVEWVAGGVGDNEPGGAKRNPPWDDRELILALDLYLREWPCSKTDPQVIKLSALLNGLPIHTQRPDAERFRNPNGVAMKLANFAAIDPGYHGKGMQRGARRDRDIWDRFAGNEDLLAEAAARVRDGQDWRVLLDAGVKRPSVERRPVEAHHTERFAIQRSAGAGQGVRREQPLVLAYKAHLESKGHATSSHLYKVPGIGSSLFCDLVDESAKVLYEAKSNTRRESIRMALGQLYDYRRFEPEPMAMAVLLPRQPHQDLIDYLAHARVGVVWQTRAGFDSSGL